MKKIVTFILFVICISAHANDIFDLKSIKINYTKIAPVIDGLLTDEVWETSEIATDFVQYLPDPGAPANKKSIVRLLFDDKNIYVAARIYDDPAHIAKQLMRRDDRGYSDEFSVGIDSYNDNRTSFCFVVSPKGNKQDRIWFDDQYFNASWDAVWEAKTNIDELGWTAEFKIPLSQLRYKKDTSVKEWGIQFYRYDVQHDEHSYWSPLPEGSSSEVAAYGILYGIDSIHSVPRLEIQPYVSASAKISEDQITWGGQIGGDIKTGLGSNFTMTATIIPDFGQVEADPANVNLTADETYYSEKRPFFMEGLDIFKFGSTRTYYSDMPYMFYSRRIGRTPRGRLPDDANEIIGVIPNESTIATAVKLSGKTQSGWSVGIFDAVTTEEKVTYIDTAGNQEQAIIEPLSNSTITRIKKDFNNGATTTGLYLSNINRNVYNDCLKDQFTQFALIGGVDLEHRLENHPEWIVSGLYSGSHVKASNKVITDLQMQPQRYYQRPDADYLTLDTNATSIDGYNYEVSISRNGGKGVYGSLTYTEVSPGFEVNDIGYEIRADYRSINLYLRYKHNQPSKLFLNWGLLDLITRGWNFGGDHIWTLNDLYFDAKFHNYWTIGIDLLAHLRYSDDRLTRGGPIMKSPGFFYLTRPIIVIKTDARKKLNVSTKFDLKFYDMGGRTQKYIIGFVYRPKPSLKLVSEFGIYSSHKTSQYIMTSNDINAIDTYDARYIFSDIDGQEAWISARLEWIISPDLTFQIVSRPFLSSYKYSNIKELSEVDSYEFDIYGEDKGMISMDENGDYIIDPDGNGSSPIIDINNPDFNYHALQSTAILRWEYRPGSVFYFVWQQDKRKYLSGTSAFSSLHYFEDLKSLFEEKSNNTFMIKFSYWFGGI